MDPALWTTGLRLHMHVLIKRRDDDHGNAHGPDLVCTCVLDADDQDDVVHRSTDIRRTTYTYEGYMRRKEKARRLRELSARAATAGIEFRCCQCGLKPTYLFLDGEGVRCVNCISQPIGNELLQYGWLGYGMLGLDGCDYGEPF